MAVESACSGLEPRACWRHFEALTKVPRPSLHEEPVIEHVRAWAARNGFELRQDAARNLVVRVPATAGRESAPTVILQGIWTWCASAGRTAPTIRPRAGSSSAAMAIG